jgi:hypothetical protein
MDMSQNRLVLKKVFHFKQKHFEISTRRGIKKLPKMNFIQALSDELSAFESCKLQFIIFYLMKIGADSLKLKIILYIPILLHIFVIHLSFYVLCAKKLNRKV